MSVPAPHDFALSEEQRLAWERIVRITNLQQGHALRAAQTKLRPWPIAVAAFTAGGILVGAVLTLFHIHF